MLQRSFCSSKSSLKRHIEAKHCIDTNYKCTMCEKIYKTQDHLRYHINTIHSQRQYKCDQCQSTFAYPSYLKRHIKIHTGEKPYVCEVRATKLLLVFFLIISHLTIYFYLSVIINVLYFRFVAKLSLENMTKTNTVLYIKIKSRWVFNM